MHTIQNALTHACMRTHTDNTHICTQANKHTHTQTHTQARVCAHMHMYIDVYIHAHNFFDLFGTD